MAIAVPPPAQRGLDFAAAAVPAASGAYAGMMLGPLMDFAAFPAAGILASGIFAASFLVMRSVGKDEAGFNIPAFETAVDREVADQSELLLDSPLDDDVLLLDEVVQVPPLILDRPYVEGQVDEIAELLLNDAIPQPAPNSRVVQLFAPQPMATAGQLADRIERHLGNAPSAPTADATDALHEALEELRRSLRRA